MNILIYVASIIGSFVVMVGMHYLVKTYAASFMVICSIGSGVAAAILIISYELSVAGSVGVIIACGMVAGLFSIPALLMSSVQDLEEKISGEVGQEDA